LDFEKKPINKITILILIINLFDSKINEIPYIIKFKYYQILNFETDPNNKIKILIIKK
jgi:hypothetical protein